MADNIIVKLPNRQNK